MRRRALSRAAQRGTTLVELMVAVVIGLVLSLAIFVVLSTFEGRRRTLGAGADLDQSGNIAMFQMDRWLRSAGTGLVQGNSFTYGCQVLAQKSSTTLLPASSLPAPFAGVKPDGTNAGQFRLAPVLILPGQTKPSVSVAGSSTASSDVIVMMSSGNDAGQVPTVFMSAASSAQLNLANTLAFSTSDLLLLVDQQPASAGGAAPCMVTQAGTTTASGIATSMPLGGTSAPYYAATISSTSISGYSSTGAAIDLGNLAGGQGPNFQVIGVGDNDTLFAYDLLQTDGVTTSQGIAEGVFELHALYGVDTTGDGTIDSWVSPTGTYAPSSLSTGTAAAAKLLKSIRAVRVGLLMRTALPERTAVTTLPLTLFADLGTGLTFTRSLTGSEQNYRYRTIEETIPVRNNQF